MHGRRGPAVESLEIDRVNLAAIAPLVAVIVALGVYPHFVVHRTEKDTAQSIAKAKQSAAPTAAAVQEAAR
jgi:NADH:ubiquinone oxidoreductase subunit 4 (subunit M)